jgi:cobalt/nickel transport system permease protein
MHIPDGFMDPKVSSGLAGVAAVALGYCFAKVRQMATAVVPEPALAAIGKSVHSIKTGGRRMLTAFGENLILKMGMVASLIFAAQMFNFPIAQGTSGHFLGGVLAAVLLGPFAGSLAMAAVVIVQSLFYADGGFFALGANLVNMALIGTFLSYYIYSLLKRRLSEELSIGIAAWFSVVLAASVCSLEIGLSGTFDLLATFLAMFKVHAVIGLAEALITLGLIKVAGGYFEKNNSL